VRSVAGLKEPQGVAWVPSTREVVVSCGGDGTVRAFDTATLVEKRKVDVGDDADNVRIDRAGGTIAVGYGSGRSAAVAFLDAATLRKKGEIRLGGHPEAFALEPDEGPGARVFVNVPGGALGGGGEVAVGDRATGGVTAAWKLKEAGRNFPMALDAPHHRLLVGCRRPARLVVIDTESGAAVASPECVGDADEVFVDGKTGRVLVVGGDGAIDVFASADQRAYTKAASVRTAPGARTGLLMEQRRALYVAVPEHAGRQAEIREYSLPE